MERMKNKYFSIWQHKEFNFGGRTIKQFVLFECKYLFSIVFFYFPKNYKVQDRFHTHAFNGLSFLIFGTYMEHILDDEVTGEYTVKHRRQFIRWFPKKQFHRIAQSVSGCLTMLISGPWEKTWNEWKDGEITIYNWNRKEITN